MKRIVCDTNVLVSGFFWKGAPRKILAGIEQGEFVLFTSRELLAELDRVLRYPKLSSILEKADVAREDILRWVTRHSTIVMSKPLAQVVVTADPSDDRVLSCAVSASADAIISGDRHLLSLCQYEDIPIVKAAYLGRQCSEA